MPPSHLPKAKFRSNYASLDSVVDLHHPAFVLYWLSTRAGLQNSAHIPRQQATKAAAQVDDNLGLTLQPLEPLCQKHNSQRPGKLAARAPGKAGHFRVQPPKRIGYFPSLHPLLYRNPFQVSEARTAISTSLWLAGLCLWMTTSPLLEGRKTAYSRCFPIAKLIFPIVTRSSSSPRARVTPRADSSSSNQALSPWYSKFPHSISSRCTRM